jgi:hypothetical protein
MHATESDDLGARFRRLVAEPERVADKIRQLLDFLHLIVVGKNDRIALTLELLNFGNEIEAGNGHTTT